VLHSNRLKFILFLTPPVTASEATAHSEENDHITGCLKALLCLMHTVSNSSSSSLLSSQPRRQRHIVTHHRLLESPPLLDSNSLVIILFLTAFVTASGTVTEATAHCADNEYEGKAGHRQAGHKKKDIQPRATFSIAKEPPAPSPLCLGYGGQTGKKQ